MKFKEVCLPLSIRVRDLDQPFEGIYLGAVEGHHGLNYLFFSQDQKFKVYGTKALHEKMAEVEVGHAVRITRIEEHQTKSGGTFIEIRVEASEHPIEGFDVQAHLDR